MSYSRRRQNPHANRQNANSVAISESVTAGSNVQDNVNLASSNSKVASHITFRQAVVDLFTTTNSILVGENVPCVISELSPIACTDGSTVFFNPKVIDNVRVGATEGDKVRALAHIIGVNYHEVAHILFSPRTSSKLFQQARNRSSDHGRVLNLLEDQRIETLFAAKFINAVPYFRSTITELIINQITNEYNSTNSNVTHLWVHGRKYLPKDLRELAREKFQAGYNVTDADLERWDSLVDEFRTLVFPRNSERALEIVDEYVALTKKYSVFSLQTPNNDSHSSRNQGRQAPVSEQEQLGEDSKELEEQWEQAESDKAEADEESDEDSSEGQNAATSESAEEPDDDADELPTEGDGTAEEDAESDAQASKTDSDSPNPSQDPAISESSSRGVSKSNGEEAGEAGQSDSVLERLSEVASQSAETVFGESSKLLSQVRVKVENTTLESVFGKTEAPSAYVPVPTHFASVYNAINKTLQQLRSDADSSWERGTKNGRLNIDLVIQADLTNTDLPVFDSWQDDTDDGPSVEVVILLDQSSSMDTPVPTVGFDSAIQRQIDEASASLWAIKKACQVNDLPCTVIGYSDAEQTSVLLRANDRVRNNEIGLYNYKRSTEARTALAIAKTIFQRSEARHKILFSLSDGAWIGEYEEIALVNAINGLGVETVFVALPCGYNHEFNYATGTHVSKPRHAFDRNDKTVYQSRGWRSNLTLPYKAGYNHKSVLLVGNSNDLAKQLGKVIISATAGVGR